MRAFSLWFMYLWFGFIVWVWLSILSICLLAWFFEVIKEEGRLWTSYLMILLIFVYMNLSVVLILIWVNVNLNLYIAKFAVIIFVFLYHWRIVIFFLSKVFLNFFIELSFIANNVTRWRNEMNERKKRGEKRLAFRSKYRHWKTFASCACAHYSL